MRTLFRDTRIAADFINGVLFNGQLVISLDDVSILDSNQNSHVFSIGITKERTRDNIVNVTLENCQCIIGIEHQAQVDKTMFQRTMDYEMSYLQQFFQYQSHLLPIKGVMTLVAYYGQKSWKHARTYKDMIEPIPPTLGQYMNVESYPLIEMRYMDEERFHTPELKELVRELKYLYESQYDDAQEITIGQEIAITLAALTKNKKIYKKAKER